jgi:hypothetical protein
MGSLCRLPEDFDRESTLNSRFCNLDVGIVGLWSFEGDTHGLHLLLGFEG